MRAATFWWISKGFGKNLREAVSMLAILRISQKPGQVQGWEMGPKSQGRAN